MKREVAVSIVIIALLVFGGLLLFTSQSNRLSTTEATVTGQANTLVAQARQVTQVASTATQAAESNAEAATDSAATQSALEDDLATSQAIAAATATQAVIRLAEFATEAGATQSVMAEELATRQSEAEATATQAANAQAEAALTQAALEDGLATRQAEATDVASTATQAAADAESTLENLESELSALEAQVDDLGAVATQAATTSANQSAMVAAAVTAQADSAATISALERDLATALAQPAGPQPTEAGPVTPTPVPTTVGVIEQATPVANVEVGGVSYHETYNQDTSWFLGEIEDAGSASLADGQYIVTVDVIPSSVTVFSPQMVADGYAEVEVDLSDCPPDSLMGLLMRVQEGGTGGYLFAFPCNLSFWAIVAFQEGVQPQILNSDGLPQPGAAPRHTIGVMMEGDSLALYLDGRMLGSATDNTFQTGAIGVYGETLSGELVLRFDNFRVWELP